MKALLPQLTFVSCLAISACLTPTDPIICAAIVGMSLCVYKPVTLHLSDTYYIGGKFAIKHVPTNLRHILSAESAANDGLAYPFLTLALYLTVDSTTKGAIGHWFVVGWLCKSNHLNLRMGDRAVDSISRPGHSWDYNRSCYRLVFLPPHEVHS
jgi:NhaP-type Na+/H+ or K+/H+ antiporter